MQASSTATAALSRLFAHRAAAFAVVRQAIRRQYSVLHQRQALLPARPAPRRHVVVALERCSFHCTALRSFCATQTQLQQPLQQQPQQHDDHHGDNNSSSDSGLATEERIQRRAQALLREVRQLGRARRVQQGTHEHRVILQRAWALWRGATTTDAESVTPDVAFEMLLWCLYGDKNVDAARAWGVWEWMAGAGLPRSMRVCTVMAEICAVVSDPDKGADVNGAAAIWQFVHNNSMQPSLPLCAFVLRACCKSWLGRNNGGTEVNLAQTVWKTFQELVASEEEEEEQQQQQQTAQTLTGLPKKRPAMRRAQQAKERACRYMLETCAGSKMAMFGGGADIEGAVRVWQDMHRLGLQPTEAHIHTMLAACAQSRHPRTHGGADVAAALQVWRWAMQHSLPLRTLHANEVIQACARSKLPEHGHGAAMSVAFDILGDLRALRLVPTRETWTTLLLVCANSAGGGNGGADTRSALQVWSQLVTKFKPGVLEHMALMRVYCQGRQNGGGGSYIKAAWKEWRRLRAAAGEEGVPVPATAYNILLQGCEHACVPEQGGGADVDGAMKLLDVAQSAGDTVAPSTYLQALRVCVRGRRPGDGGGAAARDAWRVWEAMAEHRTIAACGMVLKACALARDEALGGGADVARACDALDWVQDIGVSLDDKGVRPLWHLALRACAASRLPHHGGGADLPTASSLWHRMQQAGHASDSAAIASMLQVAARTRLPAEPYHGGAAMREAGKLWEAVRTSDTRHDIEVYNGVLAACANACVPVAVAPDGHQKGLGAPSLGEYVGTGLEAGGAALHRYPPLVTPTGLVVSSDMHGVQDVWRVMQDVHKVEPTSFTCDATMVACFRATPAEVQVPFATQVWATAAGAGCVTPYLAQATLGLCFRCGAVPGVRELAWQAWRSLAEDSSGGGGGADSVVPTATTVRHMARGIAEWSEGPSQTDGVDVLRLLQWMQGAHIELEAATAAHLMAALQRNGAASGGGGGEGASSRRKALQRLLVAIEQAGLSVMERDVDGDVDVDGR